MKLLEAILCISLLHIMGMTGIVWGSSEGVVAGAMGGINPDVPHVDPRVCSLGPTLVVDNDGTDVGWFDVGANLPVPDEKIGNLLAIANRKDLSKRVYLSYDAQNRQEQIFKGHGEIVCLACVGNTSGKDPNFGPSCPDPLNTNACVQCTKEVPCSEVINVNRCYATGGNVRAQEAGSIRKRLGLAEAHIPQFPKQIPQ